jgi:hypothetical protein
MGITITGTYATGITLNNTAFSPLTIASSASVTNASAEAVYGTTAATWTIVNAGKVQSTGTSKYSNGVVLAGSGVITNLTAASIGGYAFGIVSGQAGTVINSGAITATGTSGIGIQLPGGSIQNNSGGAIAATYVGAILSKAGVADNAGLIHANVYALGILGTGTITNEATGTITSANVGVLLTGVGTVTNFGSVASTQAYAGKGASSAIDLRAGGTVTNAAGAHVSSEWIGVQIGQRSTSVGGTVVNQGTIFASNGSNAGAAVWVHGPGLVSNDTTGLIEGGPFGVVAYYDTTIVNRGSIFGTGFAVFQSSTAASNLVEVAPGAGFTGVVEGGSASAASKIGKLELLAGSSAGSLTGFGTQFIQFSQVQLDNGAVWSLGGAVGSVQSLVFGGAQGQLTLANPTTMAGTIDGFTGTDSIVLAGVTGVTSAQVDGSGLMTVARSGGSNILLQLGPDRHDAAGTSFAFSQTGSDTAIVACFAEGTRIATDHGDIAVEALAAGMQVRSAFGGCVAVVWLGHRRTDCRRHPRPHDVWPVRIQPGAFGSAMPARELWLSPDHAVFVDGVLIPVRYLVNGRSIAQVPMETVTYWHVELPSHDVVLAEGLPCESYLDTGNRSAFANGGAMAMLHPDFALQVWQASACADLVRDGARLAAARRRLLARAAELGHVTTDDPALSLLAGKRKLALAGDWRLRHAARIDGPVRLRSRTWVPAHSSPTGTDTRVLGVAVADLTFNGKPIALDDPRLASGWHAAEAHWRWTDGDAVLDLQGRGVLTFSLETPGSYWRDEPAAARRAG